MERAIKKALSLSPKAKQIQIDAAKEKASTFSWSKTAKATFHIYKQVLQ
jgi:glycosyltransferase involved in cell wall biosynthesis